MLSYSSVGMSTQGDVLMSSSSAAVATEPDSTVTSSGASAGDDLAFAGIARQAAMVRRRELSSRELVEYHLRRIEKLDPKLNAFRIVLAERAVADAERAQKRLESGDEAPLLGVPIAIKDDSDVAGVSTMCGTGIDLGPATQDSVAVRRLREAGAIIIGKTHLPEFGIMPITESATWGATRNPWDLNRTPGGSSGGSAAAVAAGCVGAALGADGGGSIRTPAACCGLFGLKAQRGRVSTKQAPERDYRWNGLDFVGPLTRSVLDSAVFHDAIVGEEPGDEIQSPPPTRPFVDAARTRPSKLKVAMSFKPIVRGVPVSDEMRRPVYETAELLRSLGHEVVERDIDYGTSGPGLVAAWSALMMDCITEEFGRFAERGRLERGTRVKWRQSKLVGSRIAKWALEKQAAVTAHVNRAFADIDMLMTPMLGKRPLEIGCWEDLGVTRTDLRMLGFSPFTPPQNLTGQPAAAVPAGFTPDGLPLSVHLVSRTNGELTLISLAAQIEAERPWADRRPPGC